MFPSRNLSRIARHLSQRSSRHPEPAHALTAEEGASTQALSTVDEEEDWSDWEEAELDDEVREQDNAAPAQTIAAESQQATSSLNDSPAATARPDRASRQARRRSSLAHASGLKLLFEFPAPPKSLPTPRTGSSRRTDASPIADDNSIFFDVDPFRASVLGQDIAQDYLASTRALSTIASSGKEPSFYTARSRSSTASLAHTAKRSSASSPPLPTTPTLSPTPPPPAKAPPMSCQQEFFVNQHHATTEVSSHKRTLSTASRATTLSRATASVRRVGSSLKSSVQDLKKSRFKHKRDVSADVHETASALVPRLELPELTPQGFHIDISLLQTQDEPQTTHPYVGPKARQSFYGSLKDITSRREADRTARHARHVSAPSLLIPQANSLEREPAAFVPNLAFLVKPSFTLHPPRPTRAVPPEPSRPSPPLQAIPLTRYEYVDPLTLGPSETSDPRISPSVTSSAPHSPSWLSRNVIGLEQALRSPDRNSAFNFSNSSHDSMISSDSFYSNCVEASDLGSPFSVKTSTPPLSPSFPPLPPPRIKQRRPTRGATATTISEPFSVRGYIDIKEIRPPPKLTIDTHLPFPSGKARRAHAPAHFQTSRTISSRSKTPVSPRARAQRTRTRSRSNSTTRATITHFRHSIVERRKHNRPPDVHHADKSSSKLRARNSPLAHTTSTTVVPSAASTTSYAHSSPTVSVLPPDLTPLGPFASSSSSSSSAFAHAPRPTRAPRHRPRPRPQEASTRIRREPS